MQQLVSGFVVWKSNVGVPVLFFIVELPGGVGAVLDLDVTGESEIAQNRELLRKQGYAITEEVRQETTVITMLPEHWDREATIAACDEFADMWIEAQERQIKGGHNVN